MDSGGEMTRQAIHVSATGPPREQLPLPQLQVVNCLTPLLLSVDHHGHLTVVTYLR
jgi:hypothetical protein